jgi:hypothetical protein
VGVLSFPVSLECLHSYRYKAPAGPVGVGCTYNQTDPKGQDLIEFALLHVDLFLFLDYLKSLVHPTAVCDCCVTRIHGEWFRCAYCPKDLCDACEALDTHDDSHVFFVFKGPVSEGIEHADHS